MKMIIETVNNFIKKVKENRSLNDVTFVKAFKENLAHNSFDGFIAVVIIENISVGKKFVGNLAGKMYNTKVLLKVYCGDDISGETLSDATLKISDAVSKADTQGMISDINISPIVFDKDINAICRNINIEFEFCLCGEE